MDGAHLEPSHYIRLMGRWIGAEMEGRDGGTDRGHVCGPSRFRACPSMVVWKVYMCTYLIYGRLRQGHCAKLSKREKFKVDIQNFMALALSCSGYQFFFTRFRKQCSVCLPYPSCTFCIDESGSMTNRSLISLTFSTDIRSLLSLKPVLIRIFHTFQCFNFVVISRS